MTEDSKTRPPFHRNPWLWAALVGIIAIPVLRPWCKRRTRHVPKPPPVLGNLPDFQLTNQFGKPHGKKDLLGHVWVANFMFTTCRSICPRLTEQMHKLQRRYDKAKVDIRLVSISVDPEVDTPAKLLAYARKRKLNLKRWTFLTGPRTRVKALIEGGFKTHMGEKVKEKDIIDIAHTGRFALVDQKGRLRGLYSSDDKGIDEIFHRSQHVLHAKK